jgi:hypothetical protein
MAREWNSFAIIGNGIIAWPVLRFRLHPRSAHNRDQRAEQYDRTVGPRVRSRIGMSNPKPTWALDYRPDATAGLPGYYFGPANVVTVRSGGYPTRVTIGHRVRCSLVGSAAFVESRKRASGSLRTRCAQRCRSRPTASERVVSCPRSVRCDCRPNPAACLSPHQHHGAGREWQAQVAALSLPRRASRHFFPIQNPRWWRLILECDRTRLRCVSMRHTPLLVWCVLSGRLSHKRHS